MALKLYFDAMSQPCRSLMIFMKCTNIEFTHVLIDIVKGQHQTEEFKKINPAAKVPAIDDGGFTLFESGAIFQHLCNTRKVADHWYPKDLNKRAKIDEYLHWHHTSLRLGAAMTFQTNTLQPMLTGKPVDEKDSKRYLKLLGVSMEMFEKYFLANSDFISSDNISIADLMAVTELSQLEVMGDKAPALPEKVTAWKQRCIDATSPHYQNAHKVHTMVKGKFAAMSKL